MKGCCLLIVVQPAFAAIQESDCTEAPQTVEAIKFGGNERTNEKVLVREMQVKEGQEVTLSQLEADADRIKDLGLFRQVSVSCYVEDNALVAEFAMREKYYFFIAPRTDGNSDGDYSYGLHLSWHNAFGLNHRWRGTALKRQSTQSGRGSSFEYRLSNTMPFVFDSPYTLSWEVGHETASLEPYGSTSSYDQADDRFHIGLARHFSDGPASQGLSLGVSYEYRDRRPLDAQAGPDLGIGQMVSISASYRQRHDHIYSESGYEGSLELGRTDRSWGSDYSQTRIKAFFDESWIVGDTEHQTVGIHFETEMQHGGPIDGLNEYSVGGADLMRGYERNAAEGDTYAMIRIDAYRPLHWRWLRWGAFIDAGGAWGGEVSQNPGPLLSAGLGLQIRPTWFVGLVIDIGVGFPIIRNGEPGSLNFYGAGR